MRCNNCSVKFEVKYFGQKHCLSNECSEAKKEYENGKRNKSTFNKPKQFKAIQIKGSSPKPLKITPIVKKTSKKSLLQVEINTIVRLIDRDVRCIDCSATDFKSSAGHFGSTASYPTLRYNLHNIFSQTFTCNGKSEGNKEVFKKGIADLYGKDYFKMVDNLKFDYPTIHLSSIDVQEALIEAKRIVKELKNLDLVFNTETRIRLRNNYNKRIGLYEI